MSDAMQTLHEKMSANMAASDEDEELVARYLKKRGHNVVLFAKAISPTREEREKYVDNGDLGVLQRVEIKHREFDFTGPHDFGPAPKVYSDLALCNKYAFDRGTPKPYAFFHMNLSRTMAAVVMASTKRHWVERELPDYRYGNRTELTYCVPFNCVQFWKIENGEIVAPDEP